MPLSPHTGFPPSYRKEGCRRFVPARPGVWLQASAGNARQGRHRLPCPHRRGLTGQPARRPENQAAPPPRALSRATCQRPSKYCARRCRCGAHRQAARRELAPCAGWKQGLRTGRAEAGARACSGRLLPAGPKKVNCMKIFTHLRSPHVEPSPSRQPCPTWQP